MYGIRVRKAGGKWKRVRQVRNPRGVWGKKTNAELVLAKLRRKGYLGHVFEIVEFPNATHYSKHFSRAELDCKCGCKTPANIERELTKLASDLEALRLELGEGLGILSGYRCPARNKAVGGASQSQHMTGRAADLAVPTGQQDRFVKAALTVPSFAKGGVGVYPAGGVHVDRRGWVARWTSF